MDNDLQKFKNDVSMVSRYLGMRLDVHPYKFGENEFVDSFLTRLHPIVQTVYSKTIIDPDYYYIHNVHLREDGITVDVEDIFGGTVDGIEIPFPLIIDGEKAVVKFLKDREFNSLVQQIETLQRHITKSQDKLSNLEQRLNTMVASYGCDDLLRIYGTNWRKLT